MKTMKKSRLLLPMILFAVLLCVLCTACAQNRIESDEDKESLTVSELQDSSFITDSPVFEGETTAETESSDETDPRAVIVENQLKKAILVPNLSVNATAQYSIYNRSDINQRATFVLPAGEEYVKTAFSSSGNTDYANIVIPKGALSLTVTVDGFVQDGTAWNGGGAAIARAAEYGPLYDSGWLNFSSMKVGGTYGADGMVKCLEQGENHIKYVLDVSAFSRYDLIWNCTFDMKGKLENMSAVNINLEVTFGNTVEETSSTLTRIGTIGVGSYPTQGGAVYGDRLFQFHDKMGEIRVYDLKKKEMIAVCPMTPVSTYHCNNASFGAERYAENDEFPLLYVSMENIAEHNVIVLRVQRAGADFTFTKVQTITFPSFQRADTIIRTPPWMQKPENFIISAGLRSLGKKKNMVLTRHSS